MIKVKPIPHVTLSSVNAIKGRERGEGGRGREEGKEGGKGKIT